MNARWAYFKLQYPLVKRLLADAERMQQIQQRVLLDKLRLSTESRFGRDHGLASIRDARDFRRQIPITDFEYFRPYVDRLIAGETGAMFAPGV